MAGNNWWATSGVNPVTEPPAQFKANGFAVGAPLPAEHINWLAQQIPGISGSPGAAVDDIAEGGVVIVNAVDSNFLPGSKKQAINTGATVTSIDADGKFVVYCETGLTSHPQLVSRDDLGSIIRQFTRTTTGASVSRVYTDGTYVISTDLAGKVECWLLASGVSQWEYSHGAAVNDLACNGTYAFIVGASGTGTKDVRALTITGGAATWSYFHNATVKNAAYGAGRLFISSDAASGHGSAATIRCLRADNGFDAANEGGTGADPNMAWDAVQATVQGYTRLLACDGQRLALGYDVAGATELETRSLTDGIVLNTRTLPRFPRQVVIDQRNIYIYTDDFAGATYGYIYVVDKKDLSYSARGWFQNASPDPIQCIATDGFAIYCGVNDQGGGVTLARLYRGNYTPMLCMRATRAENYQPYRLQLIPPEGT